MIMLSDVGSAPIRSSSHKAGVSIRSAFSRCDLPSALSVCQLAALKRVK